ncbi:hypothetical protein [Microbaculum sp. FT89]|uniref:hypothetical protein n=1 Tax=Microbaculum sp. FT89 TaxID=3447298 RepID=UPI003F534EBF
MTGRSANCVAGPNLDGSVARGSITASKRRFGESIILIPRVSGGDPAPKPAAIGIDLEAIFASKHFAVEFISVRPYY